MNSNLISKKIAVPIVVLILCAASVVSVAWAYSVNHTTVWSKTLNQDTYTLSIGNMSNYELDGDVDIDKYIVYNVEDEVYDTYYEPTAEYMYKIIELTISDSKTKSNDVVELSGSIHAPLNSLALKLYDDQKSSVKFYETKTDAENAKDDSTVTSIGSTTLTNGTSTVYALVMFWFNAKVTYSGTDVSINNIEITLTAKPSTNSTN